MTLKLDRTIPNTDSIENIDGNFTGKGFDLPEINTSISSLTQYSEKYVNKNNLDIYRDELREVLQPLNFLNQFIRNHTENRDGTDGTKSHLKTDELSIKKRLIENSSRRKHLSQILGIELEIIEKESENKLFNNRKVLNYKSSKIKELIIKKILKLNKDFRLLTETSLKNFPNIKKNLTKEFLLKQLDKLQNETFYKLPN